MRNPYYPTIVTKFLLNPEVVDVIGFCTKNPRPMFPYLDEIKNFGQFWYISITGFDKDYEPNVPPIDQVLKTLNIFLMILAHIILAFTYANIATLTEMNRQLGKIIVITMIILLFYSVILIKKIK